MDDLRWEADEVKRRLDAGEDVVFVDARNPAAWGGSDKKLPGAIRVPANALSTHEGEVPRGKTIVTYCT